MEKKENKSNLKDSKLKTTLPWYKLTDLKEILAIVWPLILQNLFSVIISQITTISLNWYKEGSYVETISKTNFIYSSLIFVPNLLTAGILVLATQKLGAGDRKTANEIIMNGVVINTFINIFITLIVVALSPQLSMLMNARDVPIMDKNNPSITLEQSELVFVTKFFRIMVLQMLFWSVVNGLNAGLLAYKKTLFFTIVLMLSTLIGTIYTLLVLYAFKWDPFLLCLTPIISSLVGLTCILPTAIKVMNINLIKDIKFKYTKQILKLGLPMATESIFMYSFSFAGQACITRVADGEHLLVYNSIVSYAGYVGIFSSTLATVSSIFLGRAVGENDHTKIYNSGINIWKLGIVSSLISIFLLLIVSYPIFLAYNIPKNLIFPLSMTLIAIYSVKSLSDVMNSVFVRAVWATGDVYFPIFSNIIGMSIGYVILPFTLVFGLKVQGSSGLILVCSCFMIDSLIRNILISSRWFSCSWRKFIKIELPSTEFRKVITNE